MITAHPAGDNALLLELGEVTGGQLATAAEIVRQVPDVESCIVGHSSLYVVSSEKVTSRSTEILRQALDRKPDSSAETRQSRQHKVRVSMHPLAAPEFPLLLSATGGSRDELMRMMGELRLTVRYLGFRPGFAYMEGLPRGWHLPRLARPRPLVPAGSFAIAGSMAGFYPDDSPGGWNLIGRTDAVLWDPSRDQPALLLAGDSVRIEAADELLVRHARDVEPPAPEGEPIASVVGPGQVSLIVRARDPRRLLFGLPPSGPFDADAAAIANFAVGNDPGVPVMECALVGPSLRFHRAGVLSWAGSSARPEINGQQIRDSRQFRVRKGDLLGIGRIRSGMRGVLAVRGGWTDTGPRFAVEPSGIREGTKLYAGQSEETRARLSVLHRSDRKSIRVTRGPHRIDDGQFAELRRQSWRVTNDLNRIGVTLVSGMQPDGIPADLPSCGMQFGTVQWHPDGKLVVMGPDHPVTGGYLQVMTVHSRERWKIAQLTPGDEVSWTID